RNRPPPSTPPNARRPPRNWRSGSASRTWPRRDPGPAAPAGPPTRPPAGTSYGPTSAPLSPRPTSRWPRRDAGSTPLENVLPMPEFTHFDETGASRMVDTSLKEETLREARASGLVRMALATAERIRDKGLAKGDVLEVARLAGILAAKKTGELIP